jgi:nicotinamide-nucleotide amidase
MLDEQLTVLAEELGNELHAHAWRMACAESCTGGWLAKVITDISGSSQWFERGFVTYSNASKVDMLGVSEAILQLHGAVSLATATAMANGALHYSQADISVAITGIAGPGGGTLDKPVGTVWFAWARRDGKLDTVQQLFTGDRNSIRQQAVQTALAGLLRCCR